MLNENAYDCLVVLMLLILLGDGNPVKKIDLPQKYLQMAISDDKIILLGHDTKTIDFVVHTIDLSEI